MPAKTLKTLEVRSRAQWRSWLKKNCAAEAEIWLVFYKNRAAVPSLDYEDAVEEALCYGWIDSLVRRLDRLDRLGETGRDQTETPCRGDWHDSEWEKTRVKIGLVCSPVSILRPGMEKF